MNYEKAKKHFYAALGGNMNIATLKPKVFIEIMEEYHQAQLKILNMPVVSQQRELLLAYHKWICNFTKYDVLPDSRIDEFLSQ